MEVECAENFNDNGKLGTAKSAENSFSCDINVKSSEKMVVNCQESAKLIDGDTVEQTAAVVAVAARVGLTDAEPSNEDGGSAQQTISANADTNVVSKSEVRSKLLDSLSSENSEQCEDSSQSDPEESGRTPQRKSDEHLLVPSSFGRERINDDIKLAEDGDDDNEDDEMGEMEDDDEVEEVDDEDEEVEEELDEEDDRDEESENEISERADDRSKEASREPMGEYMESEDSCQVGIMDSDDETSSDDEPDERAEEDDDVAVVLDSSEEEDDRQDRRVKHMRDRHGMKKDERQELYEDLNSEEVVSSDEVDSELSRNNDSDDEREYDDLMDDIAMSKGFVDEIHKKKKLKKNFYEKFSRSRITKSKNRRLFDWRAKLKKRSLKWLLTKRMHNVDEPQTTVAVDYINRSASKGKPNHTSGPFIITQIESLADKLPTTSKSPSYVTATHSKAETNEMQVDKRFDCIQNSSSEDIAIKQINNQQSSTQQQTNHVKANRDEHNKENVGNNDKRDAELRKQNGAAAEDSEKTNTSLSVIEFVEISDTATMSMESFNTSSETLNSSAETLNTTSDTFSTVIEKESNTSKPTVKESSSCDTNSQILKEVQIETDKFKQNDTATSSEQPEKDIQSRDTGEELKYIVPSNKIPPTAPQSLTETFESDLLKNTSPVASTSIKIENTTPPTLTVIDVDSPKLSPPPLIEPVAKRSRSASYEDRIADDVHPTKKLKAQLESNFPTHDQILNEYIEKTSNNSVDEIQKHLNQLFLEIQTLSDMIKAKEIEWNNMLHLKKVKEEICFRLTRKKQIMEIMSTKLGQVIGDSRADTGGDCVGTNMNFLVSCVDNLNNSTGSNKFSSAAVSAATTTITQTPSLPSKFAMAASSTPNNSALIVNATATTATLSNSSVLNNLSNISAISFNLQQQQQQQNANIPALPTSFSNSSVQNILQNRANMKSSDLVKEKATTQRLHRNILPKPSSTTTSGSGGGISGSNISKVPVSLLTGMPTIAPVSFGGNVTAPMNLINSQTAASGSDQQPILNNYLTATATIQQQLGEMLNGHHNFNHSSQQQNNLTNGNQTLGVGRQGAFKDVKSIIADYRQKHPETVPRRGRRMKSYMTQAEASTILGNVLKSEGKIASSDLGALLAKFDGNSRPSSNDSSHSMTNAIGTNSNTGGGGGGGNLGNISFKDVLIQFAKMSGQNNTDRLVNTKNVLNTAQSSSIAPPPYPEVTLHPVSTSHSVGDQASGSLLHGILTKYNRPNPTSTPSSVPTSTTQTTSAPHYNSSFSPTLARLLTAPDRITSASHNTGASALSPYHLHHNHSGSHQASTSGSGGVNSSSLNISKMVGSHNSEITITPVVSSQVPTLLQQQLDHQQQQMLLKRDRIKFESFMNIKDDEADDSIDRLVIDEGGDISNGPDDNLRIAPNAYGQEFHENEVPVCQGCKKQEAQFVCAGCGNQWYCSRECQVTAWDEHSEICTG